MTETRLPLAPGWIKAASWLIRRLPAGRYVAMHYLCRCLAPAFVMRLPTARGGYAFRCDLRDLISREVCFTGSYAIQETFLMQALLRPGMTFVDVGANWGYFTLLAASLVGPSGRVVSLEPEPRLFPVLQDNIARNHLTQVTALPLAAAAAPGTLPLAGYAEAEGNFGTSRLVPTWLRGASTCEVDAVPLDTVCNAHGLTNIDLLKMDIEGAEGLALLGLEASLRTRRVRRLLLELHPRQLAEHGQTTAEVVAPLQAAGYRGWSVDYSRAASRRAAYARRCDIRSFLRPFEPGEACDDWPHVLWVMPGLEPLS